MEKGDDPQVCSLLGTVDAIQKAKLLGPATGLATMVKLV